MNKAKDMAKAIMMKAKAKKMNKGGWVEEENYFPKLSGEGFTKDKIAYMKDKYDVLPNSFNKGGMCYAEGGEVEHELGEGVFIDVDIHEGDEEGYAYGGMVKEDDALSGEYGANKEVNQQTKSMQMGTMKPALVQAPEKDMDRMEFVRRFMAKRAVRR